MKFLKIQVLLLQALVLLLILQPLKGVVEGAVLADIFANTESEIIHSTEANATTGFDNLHVDVITRIESFPTSLPSKAMTKEELYEIEQKIKTDLELSGKYYAVVKEAAVNLEAVHKCANKNADILTLTEINDCSFKESSIVDRKFQELKYKIQKVIYAPEGAFDAIKQFFSGERKFRGVKTQEDVEKINKAIKEFENFLHAWMHDISEIRHACREVPYQVNQPYSQGWNEQIKSHPFNRDVFRLIEACKKGQSVIAKAILKKYKQHKEYFSKDHEQHAKFLEYAHIQYIYSKFEYLQHCENGNLEAAGHILKEYENEYKDKWHYNDVIKRIHYADFQSMHTQNIKAFRIASLAPEAKTDPGLANKIWQELSSLEKQHGTIYERIRAVRNEEDIFLAFGENDPRSIGRLQSYQESMGAQAEFIPRVHELTEEGKKLYSDLGLDGKAFQKCFGNQFYQAVHAEYVAAVNTAGRLREQCGTQEMNKLAENVAMFADTGSTFLEAGFVREAVLLSNFCGSMVDCGVAVAEGTVEGAGNVANQLAHPIETATNLGKAVSTAGYYFGKILKTVYKDAAYREIDPLEFEHRMDRRVEQIDTVLSALKHKWETTSRHDKIKETTAVVVEGILIDKLIGATSAFLKGAKGKLADIAKKIERGEEVATVLTAEGVPVQVKIAEEGTKNFFERAGKTIFGEAEVAVRNFIARVEQVVNLEPEIARLRALYDGTRKGFSEFVNKYIKLDYKHILAPEINITRKGAVKLSGFHHDMELALEKSGLIKVTNKVMGKHGVYKADIWCQGRLYKGKTYFPSSWSREQVIRKVHEAYDNFIAAGAKTFEINRAGKYVVDASTNEGLIIRMTITKNGQIKTAYPLI